MVFWNGSGRRERERLTQCFNLESLRFIFIFIRFPVRKTEQRISEGQADELLSWLRYKKAFLTFLNVNP